MRTGSVARRIAPRGTWLPAGALLVGSLLALAGCGTRPAAACLSQFSGKQEFAYVAASGARAIDEYMINTCGQLAHVGSVAAPGKPSAMAVTPDDRFVYVTTASDRVAVYQVASTGALAPLARLTQTVGAGAGALVIPSSGKFLYVAQGAANAISVYRIDPASGALRPVRGSPFATGRSSEPWSLAISRAGRVLYVVERGSSALAWFELDPVSGALVRQAGTVSAEGVYPRSIALTPSGHDAYVANESDSIGEFRVGTKDGSLQSLPGSPLVLAGEFPWQVIMAPSGRFAYVVNNAGFVMEYSINTSSGPMASEGFTAGPGELLPLPGSPTSAGASPYAMALDPSGHFAFVVEAYANSVIGFRVTASGLLGGQGGKVAATGLDPQAILTLALPRPGPTGGVK